MGATTGITWTEKTWNPWRGCTKVSPGCDLCYMFRDQRRFGNDPEVVVRTKTWNDPIKWQRQAEAAGKTFLVFTCSWSDWFHKDADTWRDEAWATIKRCPNLIFQILTKRPQLIAARLPADWGDGYSNVWLGVSVEEQRFLWTRYRFLEDIPARVRFLSAEPLLGPLDLIKPSEPGRPQCDWLILGGESAARNDETPRVMRYEWARSLRDQCVALGVRFFFKQWGDGLPSDQLNQISAGHQMMHHGGDVLDGRQWHEFPAGYQRSE